MTPAGTEPALSQTAALATTLPPTRPEGPRFELRGELGLGGMGKIHLARDRWLGRDVALKVPVSDADARRLEREARLTARLEHPAIVPIYDSGVFDDGRSWFAMRVVRGSTLADRLEGLDPRDTRTRATLLRHVLSACEGVAYAHDRGVVHRDLKPANIMIGAFGETQIIDWGLALAPDLPPLDGARAGTPGAMSPEQRRGEAADARSDVWCFGAILQLLVPEPPRALRAIIQRACSERPDDRYPNAKALAHDLAAYLDGRRVDAYAYTPAELLVRFARAWRGPLIVAGAGVVVLAVVLVVMFSRLRAERDQAEANLAVSLTSEARRALRADARGEAELLAAHALARAPLVEARGILAAASETRPARVVVASLAASCRPVDLFGDRVLCQDAGHVGVSEQGRLLWQQARDNAGATFIADGTLVAVVQSHQLSRLDAATGIAVGAPEPLTCFTRLIPGSGASAFAWNGGCATRIDAAALLPLPKDVCRGKGIGTLAADPWSPRWAATCGDGSIAVGSGIVYERVDAELGTSPRGPLPSALAFLPGDRLAIGDAAGGLTEIALATPATRRSLRIHDGLVQRLAVSRDGNLLVALGERTSPIVIDLGRFATLGRLPDATIRAVAFDGATLIAAGRSLERWDFAQVLPRALEFGAGIGGLAFSPRGDTLAVGHGTGVSLIDVASRRRGSHHSWQGDTVKTFAFAQDGALLAHGLGKTAIMRIAPDGSGVAIDEPDTDLFRRLVVLADGSILAAAYGNRVMRKDADGEVTVALAAELSDLAASIDGRAVAGLGVDHELFCGAMLAPCGRDPEARALAVTNDQTIVTARSGSLARFVHGSPVTVYLAPGAEFLDVAVGESGGVGFVAGAARDGSLWLFRASAPEPWAVLRDHGARSDTITFDPLGRFVAAGGWDGHVVFWPIAPVDADRRDAVESHWGLGLSEVFTPSMAR